MIPMGGIGSRNAASWMDARVAGFGAGSAAYKLGDTAPMCDGKHRAWYHLWPGARKLSSD